ncbi:MAG: hypothetical protein K8S98_11345 [Planctomycetes bacterium]|nr:hypothetical protein [Planctomycetota bacterium]
MTSPFHDSRTFGRISASLFASCALALFGVGCSGGGDGARGPAGSDGSVPTTTALDQGDALPGIHLAIDALSGGSGPGGRFLPGDRITVDFTVTKDDGSDWDIGEFSSGRALVSGPTFNYQRVIAQVTDVATAAVPRGGGSYRYKFATPIPATYLAPYNDTASFDDTDGELTDDALLDGTYTLGMYFRWSYTLDNASKSDSGDAVHDFVIGTAGSVDSREVVAQANCNRCHIDLQAHGGSRHSVGLCLLCHTAGAEDKNVVTAAGGTPGRSIDFKVMIHKIHSGEHLPSVLGVGTLSDGSRDYAKTPEPYELVGFNNSILDFSDVAFPAWPQGLVAMPRDAGYTALSAPNKATEDLIRTGPSNCVVCHGDPDGDSGPLTAPAQGGVAYAQPRRATCGACHDDIDWGHPYTANGQTMPAIANDTNCILCHPATGTPAPGLLPTDLAHLHPLLDPDFDAGTAIDISSIAEDGTNDGDGTIDAGEKIEITFTLKNDAGTDLLPSAVANPSIVLSGPTSNYNVLLSTSIPTAMLTGAQPYTVNVPMPAQLERVGVSTAAANEVFTTDFAPHWNVTGALTAVLVRTATTTATTLAVDSAAPQNYIDVADATGFARNDYLVVDDGQVDEEYAQIQLVSGTRLWFAALGSSTYKPGLDRTHASGATVKEVTLASKTATTDFTVDTAAGTITEVTEFGNGNIVLVTYTTDFVMPSTYPLTLNGSPDLDDTVGKWVGKSIVDGTYSLSIWTSQTLTLSLYGETNSYRSASDANLVNFLVGSAATVEPYALISSGSNCYNCHQDLAFHGFGRRSFEACVVCHGAAGVEDRPQYVAANAPATTATTINFRTMLHKIHMGEELANASTYDVVGFGSSAYPNNYTAQSYGEVVFPALPGGVSNCTVCHGASNTAWHEPSDRTHPSDQISPVRRWTVVCGACHDATDMQAHIDVQTSASGQESCGVCHGEDGEWSVERMHKTY